MSLGENAAYALGPITLARGEGLRVWDDEGREYLDCISGTFNLILGHNHPVVVAAIKSQADALIFASSTFQTEETRRLMARLVEISPDNLTRVNLRSSGGSTANEGAIKIARTVTGRRDVIVPFRTHPGQTLAMAEISGFSRLRQAFPTLEARALNVPDPYCARCFYRQEPSSCGFLCVDRIADFLEYAGSGDAACLLMEPISGVGGNIVPPPGYLKALRTFCEERGILLIFDENQTSFGRTGHLFAADALGVRPDMITVSKGLTGSGLPLAAILMEERLAVLDRGLHGFTFGGGNLAAGAALASLDVITAPGFLENVRVVGAYLLDRLKALGETNPHVFEARGLGLMIGVELCAQDRTRAPALTAAMQTTLLQHGVITRVSEQGEGNVIELRPPLVLTLEDAGLIADRFAAALEEVCR